MDPEWEYNSAVNTYIRAMLHTYYEILQEKKEKSIDVAHFLGVFWATASPIFSKKKIVLMDIFSTNCVIFYTSNSLK